jgi:hypothetical protein
MTNTQWLDYSNGSLYTSKCNGDYLPLAQIKGNFASAKMLMEAIGHFCNIPNIDIQVVEAGSIFNIYTIVTTEKWTELLNWLNTHLTYSIVIHFDFETTQIIDKLLDCNDSYSYKRFEDGQSDEYGFTSSVQLSSMRFAQLNGLFAQMEFHDLIKVESKRCFYPLEDLTLTQLFDFNSKPIDFG